MDFELIVKSLPRLFEGAILTVELTLISIAIGLCLAVPLGIMYIAKNPLIWAPVRAYVFYFRGTPLLVQIFLIYYGSGQFRESLEAAGLWVLFREPYFCAILSLTLNTAAYTAYILRGAVQNVPFGEVEAARACGMSGVLLYRRIILPKAFRLALPAYSNEVVFLLQATSLVSIITLLARSFAVYEIFITAGILYLIVTYGVLFAFRKVEHGLSGHLRARDDEREQAATEALAVR
ncbi:MAG: ABC transporter permease [Alphaproteobacteria bacterium]